MLLPFGVTMFNDVSALPTVGKAAAEIFFERCSYP